MNRTDKNMHRVRSECMSVGNLARINDIWVNHHTLIAACFSLGPMTPIASVWVLSGITESSVAKFSYMIS